MSRLPRWAAIAFVLAGLMGAPETPAAAAAAPPNAARFLLYRVNPQEGFNLRRDAFMRAALLTRRLGPEWVLVLPPFERLPHWKTDRPQQVNVPWSAFFDLDALRAVVNVAEYAEFRRRWAGPIESGYGLHLVCVREHVDGRIPALVEVREAVQREWLAARRKAVNEQFYQRLRERYTVVVEQPQAASDRRPTGTETRTMKRISMLLAFVWLTTSAAGCCCCGNWFRQPAPVTAACPPPAPACDPCTTAPVAFGTPAPVAPYTPPPQL